MNWRRNLQRASFAGIRFHVSVSESEYQLRHKTHEFITDHDPITETIGRKADEFPIDGFLIGEDAHFTRDLLLEACTRQKASRLLHPQHGFMDAICTSLRIQENFDEVGSFYLNMVFKRMEAKRKVSLIDDIAKGLNVSQKLFNSAIVEFLEVFSVVNMPGFLIASTVDLISKVGTFLTSVNGGGGIADGIDSVRSAIFGGKEEILKLLEAPQTLADRIVDAVDRLSSNEAKLSLVRQIETLPLSEQRSALKVLAIAKLLIDESLGEERLNLIELISPEISDEAFKLACDLKVVLKQDRKPKATSESKSRILPSLLASFEKFGDLGHEAELITSSPFEVAL